MQNESNGDPAAEYHLRLDRWRGEHQRLDRMDLRFSQARLAMLALAVGCAAKTGGQKVDFSGVWEGSLTVEGMRMPGKMILELDSNGKGSARFGFVDELTQESIPVELNKENGLKGEGSADQMHFNFEGKFYEMEEEWVFDKTCPRN